MGSGSYPVVKRLGFSVDHPLPYSAEVKEKVELRLYSIFVACYMVRFSNYTIHSFLIFYCFHHESPPYSGSYTTSGHMQPALTEAP
jgi:hypothetical protein